MANHLKAATVASAVAGYLALQYLGRSYGATRAECHRRLPGDDLMAAPMAVTTHAITIAAPPERVWPWLVQMGWHRGAWYTAEWVDRLLFPANGPSAGRIIAEFQHLAVGDHIPDGPPEAGCEFTVAQLEAGRYLVLHSEQHLPPGWAERFGAWIDWTWTFVLDDLGSGQTRFLFRSRGRAGPAWVAAAYLLVIIPADFVMSRQMLRGIKARAERTTAADLHAAKAGRYHDRLPWAAAGHLIGGSGRGHPRQLRAGLPECGLPHRQPGVRQGKIALLGESMGGEQALAVMGTDPRIRAVVGEGVTGQQLADHGWMMHGITGVLDTGMEWVQYTAAGLISSAPRPMSVS